MTGFWCATTKDTNYAKLTAENAEITKNTRSATGFPTAAVFVLFAVKYLRNLRCAADVPPADENLCDLCVVAIRQWRCHRKHCG